jgi:hypothetical protein
MKALSMNNQAMALSVFSPSNLADMLTDKDEFASREEKIAYYKSLQSESVN